MGYTTTFEGQFTITPRVPWSQIKNSKFLPANAKGHGSSRDWREVCLCVCDEVVQTDDGELTRKSAFGIEATFPYDSKNYDIVEHLQELLDELGPQYTITSHLNATGEESGDLWRLVIQRDANGRNKACVIKPAVLWPEHIAKLTDAITKIVKEQRIKVTADVIAAMLRD